MKSTSSGFSLLEILVVMILISIASTLVYINVGKSKMNRQEKAFAREMVSFCKRTRRMAIGRGKPAIFHISSGQRRCWISDIDKSIEVPEKILIEGEGVALLHDDIYGIRFYPDGSSSGGTLTLSVSGRVIYEFRIDRLTGLITLADTV